MGLPVQITIQSRDRFYNARDASGERGGAIGVLLDGVAVRGFPTPSRRIAVRDPIFPLAARAVGLPKDDPNASDVPLYFRVPEHEDLGKRARARRLRGQRPASTRMCMASALL